MSFEKNNYCVVKEVVPKIVCDFTANYFSLKRQAPQTPQVPQEATQSTDQVTAQQVQQLFPFDTTATAIAQRRSIAVVSCCIKHRTRS